MTIELDDNGHLIAWTGSKLDGEQIEEWYLTQQRNDATESHTWEMDVTSYAIVRDILRFMGESDWEPSPIP